MRLGALVCLLSCGVLVGCGSGTGGPGDTAGTPDEPTPSGGIGGRYVADGLPSPFDEDDVLQVTFGDGTISFRATCNTFSGHATREDGVLVVGGLGGTEMGCLGRGHDQDEWLAGFFTSTPAIGVDGTDVRLASGGTVIWLVPADEVAPDPGPAVDLIGTRWQLTGIEQRDGDAVSMTMVGRRTGPALLTVEQGAIGFDTTCNTGGGDVEVVGDRLRLGQVVTTLRACLDERAEVERGVMSVLGETWVVWQVHGRELRLTAGDTTLVYVAR